MAAADPRRSLSSTIRPCCGTFARAIVRGTRRENLAQELYCRISRSAYSPRVGARSRACSFDCPNLVIDHHRAGSRPDATSIAEATPTTAVSRHCASSERSAFRLSPSVDRDVFLMREVSGLDTPK
jgi:DNA-directed RNA polymerase specialized sigma24 family protein